MTSQMNGRSVVSRPPFCFVVGCPRSGTTLLRAMLDSHPDIALPPESYFVIDMGRRRRRYEAAKGFQTERFVRDLLTHRWFRKWGLKDEDVSRSYRERSPRDYSDAVRLAFSLYAAERGKGRYGDKTPNYVLRMPLLASLFPEARFVHVIRDGRDVASSLLDSDLGLRNLSEAALSWRFHAGRGRSAGRSLGPDRYMELRYEDLVRDPEASLRGVSGFFDLTFDPVMLRYHERAANLVAQFNRPEIHRRLSLPPTQGIRDWRNDLSGADVSRFESLAGDLLAACRYERVTHPRTLDPIRRWERQLRWTGRRSIGRAAEAFKPSPQFLRGTGRY